MHEPLSVGDSGHAPVGGSSKNDLRVLREYLRSREPASRRRKARSLLNASRRKTPLAPQQQRLLDTAAGRGYSEPKLMNHLQHRKLIHDEAVWVDDLTEAECAALCELARW